MKVSHFFRISLVIAGIFAGSYSWAQTARKPLPKVINAPAKNQFAPSLSGDGKHIVFTTNANVKNQLEIQYSSLASNGKWNKPEPVFAVNKSIRNNHIGGYSLSNDGQTLYFSSKKSYGIGNYDIWYTERQGRGWSQPTNLGKPVNSAKNDGTPSVSPDGKFLYFSRCDRMDTEEAQGCELMVAARKGKTWDVPVAIPMDLDNVLSPHILPDNETLIFSAQKAGKEDLDLFQTRKNVNRWSEAVSMDFLNTEKDDRFVSIPAPGNVVYYGTIYKGGYDIIMAKVPAQLQPRKMVMLQGEVVDKLSGAPIDAYVQIYDAATKEQLQAFRTGASRGDFSFYMTEGRLYDFSIMAMDQKHTFYSELFELEDMIGSSRQKLKVELEPLQSGIEFPLQAIRFEQDTMLTSASEIELKRVIKLLKRNPGLQLEIGAHREEVPVDTTDVMGFGSLQNTTPEFPDMIEETDSLEAEEIIVPDITEIQAEVVVNWLVNHGVPKHLVTPQGYADSQPVVSNDTEANRALNRRVVARVLP
ncbi:MAG: hypothetical protein ACR2MX_12385 [Cyclobacteriaceae bacterium]